MECSVSDAAVSPLVSVLLASYNHEKYVESCVRSIMEQKQVDFELLVLDDGSTDNSHAILERLQKEYKFHYIHRENKGLIATLNEMLSVAKGKYYCTFASDDIMPPDRLYKQSKFLEEHCECVACFGQIKNMAESGKIESEFDKRFFKSVPKICFEESFLGKKALHGCSEMFVRKAILEIGSYDTRFFFEDYPLFLKVLYKYGKQPVLSDVCCCYYRSHGNNMHYNSEKIYEEFFNIIADYKNHPLYKKSVACWKANWFSALAYQDRREAIKKIKTLATPTFEFAKRLIKLFIPKFLLKY